MTTNLLDRRWTAFLIEFVLVIAGILAALAIDGWASERNERASERAYVAALVADLYQFEQELKAQIAFEDDILKTCVSAFKKANSANPAEHALPLGALLSHLAMRRTLFLESAAYTELVSTGKLGIISDRELRESIIRYFSVTARRELIMEKNNGFFVDRDYVLMLDDVGITPHVSTELDYVPAMMASNDAMLRKYFSDEMLAVEDAVLSSPPDAPQWTTIRAGLLWRTDVAAGMRENAAGILASTEQLRETLEIALTDSM